MVKHLIIAASACALIFGCTAPVAHADCLFLGCNISDEGKVKSLSFNDLVYLQTSFSDTVPVRVLRVDSARSRILVRERSGRQSWHPASNIYTPERNKERNGAIAVGALAALVGIAAIANSTSGGSESGSYNRDAERASRDSRNGYGSDTDQSDSLSADGCFWGNLEDGTCVG